MIYAEHPIAKYLARHARQLDGRTIFDGVPPELRALALGVVVNCRGCQRAMCPLCDTVGADLALVEMCGTCATRLSLSGSAAAADAGIEQVGANADEAWLRSARGAVLAVADRLESFSADDVWSTGLPKPREPRALGYVMRTLAQEGRIEATGEFHKTAQVLRHHAPVMLWRRRNETEISAVEVMTYDALCLKEPWLELILLGIKTLETRTKCLRKKGGETVLTSSQSYDEYAWEDPNVGGRLDADARRRAMDGLGKLRGMVALGPFRPGVPGVDDAAACISIRMPDGKLRFVSQITNPRRVAERPTARVGSFGTLVLGSSQGFFRVPKTLVEAA